MEDRRSQTSALNGAKSKGPTSPEGKARSARTAEKQYGRALKKPLRPLQREGKKDQESIENLSIEPTPLPIALD